MGNLSLLGKPLKITFPRNISSYHYSKTRNENINEKTKLQRKGETSRLLCDKGEKITQRS
jgi:hypothetical protein